MKYTHFEIENFKGIEKVRIDLETSPRSNVYTLIGLNESGKTTVLQGIDLLTYREDLDPLNLPGYEQHDIHELIPIAKRSNFNEKIVIKAGFRTNEKDKAEIKDFALKNLGVNLTEPIETFTVTQNYKFEKSRVIDGQPGILWNIKIIGRKKGQRKPWQIKGEDWQEIVQMIKTLLPRVLYFPNFLFEFPDRIYLENPPLDTEKHKFYRTVLQDVLDATGDNTNLEEHVLQRAKSSDSCDERSLESVLLKMGSHITKTVFENWDRIFKRPAGKKEIVVDIDKDERNAYYLRLRLKEGSDMFAISERSLGFRWFFTFLLLTHYRGFRTAEAGNVLFLLDEPASNLHPSAQSQLLESFTRLPDGCGIIYTTHSHHMINPEWLESAFVVKNEALHYTGAEDQYSARQTKITLHRYREFASQHPEQHTYFQPVLDVLDYSPGRLENVPDVVMLEGKNDFYVLKFMCKQLNRKSDINLLPGGGAGSLTDVIRLYVSWGRNFIVILDSDQAGVAEKQRYEKLFGAILENRLFTLKDIEPSWAKVNMEKLFTTQDRDLIQRTCYPDSKSFNKTQFNRAVEELYLTKHEINLSPKSLENFGELIDKSEAFLNNVKNI
jgi:hypothetical protein